MLTPGMMFVSCSYNHVWLVLELKKNISGWIDVYVLVMPDNLVSKFVTSEAEPVELFENHYYLKQLVIC